MNKSIINCTNHADKGVASRARMLALIEDENVLAHCTFVKADKVTPRPITFYPARQWNTDHGELSTPRGQKAIATKCSRGMITVVELCDDGTTQCRSVNLGTIIGEIEILG